MQRIVLVGFQGSGKNTVGEYLVSHYGYTGISFADALKDAVASICCWDRALLEGNTPEAREWRETVDEWWANKLGIPDFTPRWMLRNFGTELMRRHFHQDVWINNVERRVLDMGDTPVVVFDGRFPNEIDLVTKALGGTSIRVKRGPEPYWYEVAAEVNRRERRFRTSAYRYSAEVQDVLKNVHESEMAWIGYPIDITIENDGSIDDLHGRVDALMEARRATG